MIVNDLLFFGVFLDKCAAFFMKSLLSFLFGSGIGLYYFFYIFSWNFIFHTNFVLNVFCSFFW